MHYGVAADGLVDRNHSTGRGGYIPSLSEIRNCHINVGTGKEFTIRELSELVVKAVGFEGTVEYESPSQKALCASSSMLANCIDLAGRIKWRSRMA